jgi:protein MpaA
MFSDRIPRTVWALMPLVLVSGGCTSHPTSVNPASHAARSTASRRATAAKRFAVAPTASIHRSVFGHSVQGREFVVFRAGPVNAPRRILVVGVIHVNETAGRAIALDLLRRARPVATEVVVVPDLNPDGSAHGTRQNAAAVDLNRNFPYRWTRLGVRGDQQYSGTRPLSEPESRAMAKLIGRVHPTVSVWLHRPVGVVDESGGSALVEGCFATILGLPLERMQRYNGSVVSWENTTYQGPQLSWWSCRHT